MRPIVSWQRRTGGDSFTWFLPPLGSYKVEGDERVGQLLPVARYTSSYDELDRHRWSFLSLPGIYWAKTLDGRTVRAWFPFGGVVELEDPETNEIIEVDGRGYRAAYVDQLAEFRDAYRRECFQSGIDYVPLDTSMQFDKALMEYLLTRRGR